MRNARVSRCPVGHCFLARASSDNLDACLTCKSSGRQALSTTSSSTPHHVAPRERGPITRPATGNAELARYYSQPVGSLDLGCSPSAS